MREQSPYLLQHAGNPVDWYPWTDDAFTRAKKEDKPVFLSIGYSTCHWCHVMEAESFEDEEVAALLNNYFIAIKVDREEHPDIDSYYMTAAQLLAGTGGWPLTIVMTPDKEPFYAATYIPKRSFTNRTGMLDLLPALHEAWENRKSDISKSAAEITNAVKSAVSQESAGAEIAEGLHTAAFDYFESSFDAANGG
ncbi:MAG: thioredoxin domain-containing protein, partial [Spirochaetales bacterium]|nr:thioredoxin domain-containing protein [Spirochaetales bacterium]